MKNLKLLNLLIFAFVFSSFVATSQSTTPSNNTLVGAFLGYDGAQNLEFRTNNIIRMQLTETNTATINGLRLITVGFWG